MASMLDFRVAASKNNLSDLERLSQGLGGHFIIDEPGPKSGKTAAHVAAEKAHFKAIYWLFEKGADFSCKDNAGKTALDYLQQKEFSSIHSNPMSMGDRKYYLCNAHCKIWFAHDPECFMPYLYQEDFRQYREKNPDGCISLVYSEALLSDKALSELVEFAEKYQIELIAFEKDFARLTDQFGTEKDKQCYQMALYELNQYPDRRGGNLAVVSDLIRWSTVLLRKGSYTDTDVEVGQHKWTNAIGMEKTFALNLGSLIYPNRTAAAWLNGDIIAISSLFSKPHPHGDFRITLSKTACYIIEKVQSNLLVSCQKNMKKRIVQQEEYMRFFSDLSAYLKLSFLSSSKADPGFMDNFSSDEIKKIQAKGLELFSQEERASLLERLANLRRKGIEQEYGSRERAQKYSRVFQKAKDHEHEKFLMAYMQAMLKNEIKDQVMRLTGIYILSEPMEECIKNDHWEKYSIHSNQETQSAFRSRDTVKFCTDFKDYERSMPMKKHASLSFTPEGMEDVMERSEALKAEHEKNGRK